MKIIIIIIIIIMHLISGRVSCYDISGFLGRQVIIHCSPDSTVYFCKVHTHCEPLTLDGTQEHIRQIPDKYTVVNSRGPAYMIIRNLSIQDAGMYECGEGRWWKNHFNLRVNDDPCCTGTTSLTGHVGRSVTISCSYPAEFDKGYKALYRMKDQYERRIIETSGSQHAQHGRVSISVDQKNKVFRVDIGDLTDDDGGIYSCGVEIRGKSYYYYSFLEEIRLQVTEENPQGTPETRHPGTVIISMCICISLLLLIAGFIFIYRLIRRKTQDSETSNQQAENNITTSAASNNNYQNIRPPITIIYQNVSPDTNPEDSLYQRLDRNAIQSFYERLNPSTVSSPGD